MTKSTPPSDLFAYAVVLGTVAAMLMGKYLMFFDRKASESEAEKLDDEAEAIVEETMDEVTREIEEIVEEKIK
jgi:hypothetical protein